MYWDGLQWRYCDNNDPTAETHMSRPCGECGKLQTSEGHDPCIGTLPDVMNACCGHGRPSEAYIQYNSGKRLSGIEAMNLMVERGS